MDDETKKQNISCEHPIDTAERESATNLPRHARRDASFTLQSREEARQQSQVQLEEARQNFADRKVAEPRRTNKWASTIFFVAVLALTLFLMYQLSQNVAQNQKTLAEILTNIRTDYAIYAICILLAMMLLDTLKYFIIIHAVTGQFHYGMSVKTGIVGKFYDNITPFSSGGQPFQAHYLYKKGLTGGESSAIISIKFCFNVLIWLGICFCLMVFDRAALTEYVADEAQRNLFSVLGWVGFGFNCLIPMVIIAFAIFPKMTEAAIRWTLKLGHKLHIVKNREAIVEKAKRGSGDFRAAFVIMAHKPLHAILLAICCFCEPFLGMTLPYFVVVAFAGNAITPNTELMFAIMTLNVYVSMSVTIVPTPGNSGAMESAFLLVLTTVAESVLFWSVLTWRFLSYYSYIIIGLVVLIVDFVRKAKKGK